MRRLLQKPTVLLLNAALLACIALLVFLLGTSVVHNSSLALHFGVLLVFAVGLLASVNWCAREAVSRCHGLLPSAMRGSARRECTPKLVACTWSLVHRVIAGPSLRRVLSQVGIVSAEEQRKQLFGSDGLSDSPLDPPGSAQQPQPPAASSIVGEAVAHSEAKKQL